MRSRKSCLAHHQRWKVGGKIKKDLKFFMGCKEPPISIFEDEDDDTPFLYLFPPPMLHILLGCANDALTKMQEMFEDEMLQFLKEGGFER